MPGNPFLTFVGALAITACAKPTEPNREPTLAEANVPEAPRDKAAPTAGATEPKAKGPCDDARAREIDAYVTAVCDASGGPAVVDLKAAVVTWEESVPDGVLVDGVPIGVGTRGYGMADEWLSLGALEARWQEEDEKARDFAKAMGDRKREPLRWIVVAQANVKTSAVADLLALMHSNGFSKGGFVFGRPVAGGQPPIRDEALYEQLRKIAEDTPANDRASAFADAVRPIAETCAGVPPVFGKVAEADAELRCHAFEGLGKALVDCGCPDIEDKLLTFHWALNLDPDTPNRAAFVPVELDRKADPWTVPADQTWADFAKTTKGPEPLKLRLPD